MSTDLCQRCARLIGKLMVGHHDTAEAQLVGPVYVLMAQARQIERHSDFDGTFVPFPCRFERRHDVERQSDVRMFDAKPAVEILQNPIGQAVHCCESYAAASLGSLAAVGTSGILIPPSVNLLVYGSLASVSVGQLFIAGIIPGILLTLCFMVFIAVQDSLLPGGEFKEADIPLGVQLRALRHLIPEGVVFLVVMGSIYPGIARPTESAALAVIVALGFVWAEGKLSLDFLDVCFRKTARKPGMILLMIAAASTLNVTLALAGITRVMSLWVDGLGLTPVELLFVLMFFYLVLGMFMDVLSMPVLTIPVVVPDELPVAALRDAGVIIAGKGNTPEFAVEGCTRNDTFAATGNPYDPRLTPGGSSGGVVAAVASGIAVAGLAIPTVVVRYAGWSPTQACGD